MRPGRIAVLSLRNTTLLALGLLGVTTPLSGQAGTASPVGTAMADNFTTLARGFSAVGVNPALLGMWGNPGFSLALPTLGLNLGLDPITLGDLADFEGRLVPVSTKNEWLAEIEDNGEEAGTVGLSVTPLALSVGRIGLQYTVRAFGEARLNPDAAELLLFGNAGRDGVPGDFALAGSSGEFSVLSTASVALGIPFDVDFSGHDQERFSLGITVKYIIGHFIVSGRDGGGVVRSDPLGVDVRFPIVQSGFFDDIDLSDVGTGVGIDVGAAWAGGPWTISLALQDLINSFEWDTEGFLFRPGSALFDGDNTDSDFDLVPAAGNAPQSMLDDITSRTFDPRLAVGVGWTVLRQVDLTFDFRQQLGDSFTESIPDTHVGIGVEFRPVGYLPLRAGVARVEDGFQVGTGLGLKLGSFNLSVGIGAFSGDRGDAVLGSLGLSWGAQ